MYNSPFPEPLNSVCRVGAPFGFALVLAPGDHKGGIARLAAEYLDAGQLEETRPGIPTLQELWGSNPTARGLPLLERLARREAATLQLAYGRGRIEVQLEP